MTISGFVDSHGRRRMGNIDKTQPLFHPFGRDRRIDLRRDVNQLGLGPGLDCQGVVQRPRILSR